MVTLPEDIAKCKPNNHKDCQDVNPDSTCVGNRCLCHNNHVMMRNGTCTHSTTHEVSASTLPAPLFTSTIPIVSSNHTTSDEHDLSTSAVSSKFVSVINLPTITMVIISVIIVLLAIRKRNKSSGGSKPLLNIPDDPLKSVPRFSRDSLKDLEKIGEGHFGEVKKGKLHSISKGETHVETVAVKMLKENAMIEDINLEARANFLKEVKIMSSFHHPNILALKGVCYWSPDSSSPPWMIFEYMQFGDLLEVLRNSNPKFWKRHPNSPILTEDSLLSFSLQIATGMEYLSSRRYVHRDLACRNCLVGSTLTVKISDFGMSRDIYVNDYYIIGGARHLPIRWMSPESIQYLKFTVESDIWAYGVLLWEIYTYGLKPYYGHEDPEVLILKDILLDVPENCPDEVANIMQLCWKKDMNERIPFSDICSRLSVLKKSMDQNGISPAKPTVEDEVFEINEIDDDHSKLTSSKSSISSEPSTASLSYMTMASLSKLGTDMGKNPGC